MIALIVVCVFSYSILQVVMCASESSGVAVDEMKKIPCDEQRPGLPVCAI